jgi:hypothetical protein
LRPLGLTATKLKNILRRRKKAVAARRKSVASRGRPMYRTTSDRNDYLKRVGSHATKERRTGRIDAIPKWADPVVSELTAEQKEQLKALRRQQAAQLRTLRAAEYRELLARIERAERRGRRWCIVPKVVPELKRRLRRLFPDLIRHDQHIKWITSVRAFVQQMDANADAEEHKRRGNADAS